jgi:hypothetical protein
VTAVAQGMTLGNCRDRRNIAETMARVWGCGGL